MKSGLKCRVENKLSMIGKTPRDVSALECLVSQVYPDEFPDSQQKLFADQSSDMLSSSGRSLLVLSTVPLFFGAKGRCIFSSFPFFVWFRLNRYSYP